MGKEITQMKMEIFLLLFQKVDIRYDALHQTDLVPISYNHCKSAKSFPF